MLIAVDVNATFNTVGDIKPLYIRLEDNNHKLHVCKIIEITEKEFMQNGLHNYIMFTCVVKYGEATKTIKIKYCQNSGKWLLLN